MDRRLAQAAVEGNVESLLEILRDDPLALDNTIVACISETPLHIAAILGHLNFVKQLLKLRPELAAELNSQGCSALHLAAAKGHLEIVKELLGADADMGLVRNLDGRTALHLAVIKGRVAVVSELIRAKPEFTRVLTDLGETLLHLCVKNNRLKVLKLLTESIEKESDLVNWKDSDGNTILHIAVAKKQIEIINCLLTMYEEVEVNALNRSGKTALDILTQSPRDLRYMDIEDALRRAGAFCAKDLHLITSEWIPEKVPQITDPLSSHQSSARKRLCSEPNSAKKPPVKQMRTDWLGRKRSALMVVASLIATVAFQAGLTPPGGVWQDDKLTDNNGNPVLEPHVAGTAVMADKAPREYGLFMIFNTVAFLQSLSIFLLLVSGLPLRRRRWMWLQMITVWVAITAQVGTYFVTLRYMSPDTKNVQRTLGKVTEISVLAWLSLMGVIFIGNIIRMNLWILRKYGYLKQKERVTAAEYDGDEL